METLIQSLADKIGKLGLREIQVDTFTGESKQFKSWVRSIEKCALINKLPDDEKSILALRYSDGIVSDFLQRYLEENTELTCAELKKELTHRYGEVTDKYIKFAELRYVKQHKTEKVQDFAERVLILAREAYQDFEHTDLVDHQVTGIFVDGLIDESIKIKLIRANPQKLEDAISKAKFEQDIKIKCRLRTGNFNQHEENGETTRIQCRDRSEDSSIQQELGNNVIPVTVDYSNRNLFCTFCKLRNHNYEECRHRLRRQINGIQADNHRFRDDSDIRLNTQAGYYQRQCWFCQEMGHIKINCYKWRELQGRFKQAQGKSKN